MHISNRLLEVAAALHVVTGQVMAVPGRTLAALKRRQEALQAVGGNARGDVPGWVLITLMSAVLVAGLLAIAGPALEQLFNQAMEQVQP